MPRTVNVELTYRGVVRVSVPDGLSSADELRLARYTALSQVTAILRRPPEEAVEEALRDEYRRLCEPGGRAESDWAAAETEEIGGHWSLVGASVPPDGGNSPLFGN